MSQVAYLQHTLFFPRPRKHQLLFIFEASDTFADLEYGPKAGDLFSSGHVAIIAGKNGQRGDP